MILFYLLLSLVSLCYGQNAALSFKCPEAGGDTLTIEAVYSGTGTPLSVIWTYSGASLTIETGGCTEFGAVPAGFIDSSRLSYECVTTKPSLPPNTYQLLVSGLQDDILGKTWAVTFTPPAGAAPVPVSSNAPSKCSGSVCPKDCKDRVIASIVFGSLGIIALALAIIFFVTRLLNSPVCLAADVLDFVFDIISLGLSASFLDDDDCEDCKDWKPSAIAFVVIPSIVAVVAIAVLIKICYDMCCGNGN